MNVQGIKSLAIAGLFFACVTGRLGLNLDAAAAPPPRP